MTLESLERKIREIQALMIAYATNGRTNEQPEKYRELYIDLSVELERCNYSNPNPYTTIETFWDACGSTWADRRRLVSELYADVLFDIGRQKRRAAQPRNWQAASD